MNKCKICSFEFIRSIDLCYCEQLDVIHRKALMINNGKLMKDVFRINKNEE